MKLITESASHPEWADESGSIINLSVKFAQFTDAIPFSATSSDVEGHGRDLFNRAVAGEFGLIAPYVAPVLNPEQIIAEFTAAIQQHLDNFARTRNYDNTLSACTYATSTVPKFAIEGQYCVKARDETWNTCYAILSDVKDGVRPMPSLDEIMSELPTLEWPQ